jgi:alanine racemase
MNTLGKIWRRITAQSVKYQPLIEVRIFKDALLNNLHQFQKTYPKFKFAPVLKSNAYGYGLVQVAKIFDKQPIAFFTVDSFFESLVLRREGLKSKILVLGYATMEQINKSRLKDLSFAIIDLQQLKNIANSLSHTTAFHLKIDTGMHRQGILPEDLEQAISLIKSNPKIILEGACSHFADADGADQNFTKTQIQKWNQLSEKLKSQFPTIKYLHLSNTAGAFFLPEIKANVARVGIGLFGFNTSPFSNLKLRPALEMASMITSIKTIPSGEKVGYNITYTAPREVKVATVPVGYNEGVDVRLSNKGFFKLGANFCAIVGKVSMNMCSIDVSDVKNVKLEDEVIVISKNPEDKNSIDNIIKICGSSRYEVPIHIPQHLRRVVI